MSIVLLFLIVSVSAFYAHFEYISNKLKQDMGYAGYAANAVKHAYAAAEIYQFFLHFMTPLYAENAVLWLGTANEYAERVIKFRQPDSFTEVLKDYHNNLAGIVAMQWRLEHANDRDMFELLVKMADDRILVLERDKNPFFEGRPPAEKFMPEADKWLSKYKGPIKDRVSTRLKYIQP